MYLFIHDLLGLPSRIKNPNQEDHHRLREHGNGIKLSGNPQWRHAMQTH